MAQPFLIDLGNSTRRKSVQINDHWHGQRLSIRVINAEKPVAIGIAPKKGGTGQTADASYAQAGVAVPDMENAYDFTLRHENIEGVVGEGRTFYFNIWEYDPDDEMREGRMRASGVVPIGRSIFVPRPASM